MTEELKKEAEEWANKMYPCDGQAQRYLLVGAEFGYNKAMGEVQEKLKADLIINLKERIQYSTSPSCTKGMELFIKSIEEWEIKEK